MRGRKRCIAWLPGGRISAAGIFEKEDIEWACNPLRRMRGMAFGRQSGEVLVLYPCKDIHTMGMRHAIDVAFVDDGGRVLSVVRELPPWRRMRNDDAVAVCERIACRQRPWPRAGDLALSFNAGREGKEGKR